MILEAREKNTELYNAIWCSWAAESCCSCVRGPLDDLCSLVVQNEHHSVGCCSSTFVLYRYLFLLSLCFCNTEQSQVVKTGLCPKPHTYQYVTTPLVSLLFTSSTWCALCGLRHELIAMALICMLEKEQRTTHYFIYLFKQNVCSWTFSNTFYEGHNNKQLSITIYYFRQIKR